MDFPQFETQIPQSNEIKFYSKITKNNVIHILCQNNDIILKTANQLGTFVRNLGKFK